MYTGRKRFISYPHIQADEPMRSTIFYLSLSARRKGRFLDDLPEYLGRFGFMLSKHTISPEQLRRHRYTHECFRCDRYAESRLNKW